jgi:hypothetical protein
MSLPAPMIRLLTAALPLLLLFGCGGGASYELKWTIGCARPDPRDCGELKSVKQCSSVGLDSVLVLTFKEETQEDRTPFPCFSVSEGSVGYGPDLSPGTVRLSVSGLSPGGQTLSGPVIVDNVQIGDAGLTEVWVNLPTPAQCADGVDNDGDGHVDLRDPECQDLKDTDESK